MKKTITLALFLGLSTALSAQFLCRSQRIEMKNGYKIKILTINLDTMPQVQFISVCFRCRLDGEVVTTFDIGDGFDWKWVDATYKTIFTNGNVDGLNKLSQLNWVMQMPIYDFSIYEGTGSLGKEWLFKRQKN